MPSNWGKYPSQTPEYQAAYLAANPDVAEHRKARRRERNSSRREELNARQRARYAANRERAAASRRAWRAANPEREAANAKARREKRSPAQRERDNARARRYYEANKDNPKYIMPKRLRSRLYQCVRGKLHDTSAVRHLGCTVDELRAHIESQFQPGMTWENWGQGEGKWHIDHISPLSAINHEDEEAMRQACHYTNLQPMWGSDNIRKGAR
jgi:hypothetical protein